MHNTIMNTNNNGNEIYKVVAMAAADHLEQITDFAWIKRGGKYTTAYHLNGERDKQGTPTQTAYYPESGIFNDISRGAVDIFEYYRDKCGLLNKWEALKAIAAICGVTLSADDERQARQYSERAGKWITIAERLRANLNEQVKNHLNGQPAGGVLAYLLNGRCWSIERVQTQNQRAGAFIGVLDAETLKILQSIDGERYGTFSSHNLAEWLAYCDQTDSSGQLYIKLRYAGGDQAQGGKNRNPHGNITIFNAFNVSPFAKQIYICEGEATAFAMIDAGHTDTIATRGAGNIQIQITEFVKKHSGAAFYIMMDNDKAAAANVEKLAGVILAGGGRCNVCTWAAGTPDKYDIDDLTSKQPAGRATLQTMIENALPFWQYETKQAYDSTNNAKTPADREQARAEAVAMVAAEPSKDTRQRMAATYTRNTDDTGDFLAAVEELRQRNERERHSRERREKAADLLKATTANAEEFAAVAGKIHRETAATTDTPPHLEQYPDEGDFYGDISHDPAADIVTPLEVCDKRQSYKITLPAGQIVEFAAGTGQGKTAVIQNLVYYLLHDGYKVAYFSLEEDRERAFANLINIEIAGALPEWGGRLSYHCGNIEAINKALHVARQGGNMAAVFDALTTDQQRAAAAAVAEFYGEYIKTTPQAGRALYLYGNYSTAEQIAATIEQERETINPDVYLIDYVQILQAADRAKGTQPEEMAAVMKILIQAAKATKKPFVLAAQVKEKNNDTDQPRKLHYTDILGASTIAQAAAAVYMVANGQRYDGKDTGIFATNGDRFDGNDYLYFRLVKARFGAAPAEGVFKFNGGRRLIDTANVLQREGSTSNGGNALQIPDDPDTHPNF